MIKEQKKESNTSLLVIKEHIINKPLYGLGYYWITFVREIGVEPISPARQRGKVLFNVGFLPNAVLACTTSVDTTLPFAIL